MSIGQSTGKGTQSQNVTASGTTSSSKTFQGNAFNALNTALTGGDFTKAAAVTDSAAATNAAIQTILQQQVPGLTSATKTAGGYDSTTAALMGNDLAARTAAAGAQVTLNTIGQYAANQANQVNAASNAVNVTSGQTTQTSGTSNTTGASSTQQQGVGVNPGQQLGTVICTQLWKDGHMSDEVYYADNRYVRRHFSRHTVNGYRFWAVPFVYLMRRNKLAYAVGKYFGLAWSHHCASKYCAEAKANLTGALLTAVMVPACFCIGAVIPDVEYYKLWKGSY